jgi:N-acetylmuramoyl-L-alanine amidase
VDVTAIRYWSIGDVTRIAIETSAPVTFRTDRLYKPERVFFDLNDSSPKLDGKGVYYAVVKDSRVRQIRVAQTQPTVTRIVLDLEVECDVTASQVSAPDRLLVEVRAKSGAPPPPRLSSNSSEPDAPYIKPEARPYIAPSKPSNRVRRAEIKTPEPPFCVGVGLVP